MNLSPHSAIIDILRKVEDMEEQVRIKLSKDRKSTIHPAIMARSSDKNNDVLVLKHPISK